MSVPVFLVDAFAAAPFSGNTAAVCLLDAPADPIWMQAVAAELQQPATAFVHPTTVHAGGMGDADGTGATFGLRWFVPAAELVLCGHGTLATAHVLWETGRLSLDAPARFQTVSGELLARRDGDAVVLDFPAERVQPVVTPSHLVEALGVEPRAVLRGRLDYLVELGSEDEIRALQPDMALLRQVETRGTIVTAPAAPAANYDVVSRFFAPAFGLNEDSVTGSAHCALGPYWGARFGQTRLLAYQASARGGLVRVDLDGERVRLAGSAVTVLSGSLLAPLP